MPSPPYSAGPPEGISAACRNDYHPLIYQILDYIQIHYQAPIHIETLARLFSLSRSRLYSDFRAVTGSSPADYILQFRLTKAKEFLASGHSVEMSGRLAGFSNLAHFSHTFKHRCGICPKQFQKQQRAAKKAEPALLSLRQ